MPAARSIASGPRRRPREPEFAMHEVLGRTFRTARWRAEAGAPPSRPLLFFTGIGANIELLAPFLEGLEGREVVTFDLPGTGGSPDAAMPYRLSTIAKCARQLLNDLGYDEVDVMGVSWGGMLAQQFAFQYREQVPRLILAATSAGFVMVPGRLSALALMLNPRRYADPHFMEKHLQTLYGGTTSGLKGYAARSREPTRLGYLYQLLALSGWTSVLKLPHISAETLILSGDDDPLVKPANAQLLKLLMRRARLEMLPDAGHLFLLTHRPAVTAMVEDFLDTGVAQARSAKPAAPRYATA